MQFEDMQVLWREQDEQPLYAIDQNALDKIVENEVKSTTFLSNAFEWSAIVGFATIGVVVGIEPIETGREHFQFIEGGIMLCLAAWVYGLRRKRLAYEKKTFSPNIIGEIERALFVLMKHVEMIKTYAWITVITIGSGIILRRIVYFGSHSVSGWAKAALFPVVAFLIYKGAQFYIRKIPQPASDNLKALLNKLKSKGEDIHKVEE